jgi:predicted metal-binding membrane protein
MVEQRKISARRDEGAFPFEFVVICVLAFVASVAATIYFCRSVCCDIEMPGGWTMSMMWMRMRGQTWVGSATNFLLMWLAMMVAMMLPSALPTFLKTKRPGLELCSMASGYLAMWFAAGVVIYAFGVMFATVAVRSEWFSRAVPWLLGATLLAAGAIQFTRWKMTHLLRCRSRFGCAVSCADHESSFRLGCKQGAACCLCCASPTAILTALGMMNPFVVIGVTIVVTAEKLMPRPDLVTRLVGVAAILTGVATTLQKLT